MNFNNSACDDQQLLTLLRAEEGSDESLHAANHVQQCDDCQQRLEELAASDKDWDEAGELLAAHARDTAVAGSQYANRWSVPHMEARPVAWNDAMAKSLLSAASHPEMLGRIGRYDVERVIGSGGMGVVFKAYDTELNRPVAVKLLAPFLASSGAARQRFAREARAAAAVVDEHVVAIHNVESDGAHPFLVMKYIGGGSLQQRLDREGSLEVCEVLRIGMHTAKGLAAAHAQGLIHRDVKPSNILLDEGVDRALLTDFGLARASDDASLTRSGFQPGTPHYMSPEQVRGEAIDGRSDLFGLGCVLYALCTGHPPFRSETSYAVLRRITDDTPRPIREINPDVPAWLEQIVMKLLAKSPEDRFDSAEQVAELLEDCLAHVQQPITTPLPAPVAKLARSFGTKRKSNRSGTESSGDFRNGWHSNLKFAAAAAAAFSLFFLGVLIVLEINKGTLRIESEADVPIRVMQGDKIVEELIVTKAGESVRIAAGEYVIVFEGPHDGLTVDKGVVSITRGHTSIVTVTATVDDSNHEHLADQQNVFEKVGAAHGRFLGVVEASNGIPTKANGHAKKGTLCIRAFIEDNMVHLVRVGNPTTIKIDALPATILVGKVESVIYVPDAPMRNGIPGAPFEAIISFDTEPGLLKPGMTGEVDIVDDSGQQTGEWPTLEGKWRFVSYTSTDPGFDVETLQVRREGMLPIVILGNRWIRIGRDGQQFMDTFVYDPEATPQTFDILQTRNGRTFRSPYIVAIDGDKLRLAYSMNGGNQRPTSFDAPRMLVKHYKRVDSEDETSSDVEKVPPNDFYVIGLVQKPDKFAFPVGQEIRLLDAIAMAGGPKSEVTDSVLLLRSIPGQNDRIVIRTNLRKAKQSIDANLLLVPGDVLSLEPDPLSHPIQDEVAAQIALLVLELKHAEVAAAAAAKQLARVEQLIPAGYLPKSALAKAQKESEAAQLRVERARILLELHRTDDRDETELSNTESRIQNATLVLSSKFRPGNLDGLRFGERQEHEPTGGFFRPNVAEPGETSELFATFPTLGNGIDEVALIVYVYPPREDTEPSQPATYLIRADGIRQIRKITPRKTRSAAGNPFFMPDNETFHVGYWDVDVDTDRESSFTVEMIAGIAHVDIVEVVGLPNEEVRKSLKLGEPNNKSQTWLPASLPMRPQSQWASRLLNIDGWEKDRTRHMPNIVQQEITLEPGETRTISIEPVDDTVHMEDATRINEQADAQSFEAILVKYNDETREVRRELFDPPIPDMTLEQMRQGFAEGAKRYRSVGKIEIANLLEKFVKNGRLDDGLLFHVGGTSYAPAGQSGKRHQFRQLAPSIIVDIPSPYSKTNVILSSIELRYSSDGYRSKTYGDVHPPIDGTWELLEAQQGDTKMSGDLLSTWLETVPRYSQLIIGENKLVMPMEKSPDEVEGRPVPADINTYDLKLDYSTIVPRFIASRGAVVKLDGIFSSDGFIEDKELHILLPLGDEPPPRTFNDKGERTLYLKYQRRSNVESAPGIHRQSDAVKQQVIHSSN